MQRRTLNQNISDSKWISATSISCIPKSDSVNFWRLWCSFISNSWIPEFTASAATWQISSTPRLSCASTSTSNTFICIAKISSSSSSARTLYRFRRNGASYGNGKKRLKLWQEFLVQYFGLHTNLRITEKVKDKEQARGPEQDNKSKLSD